MKGNLVVLTGGRGRGKTTLCRQIIEIKTHQGWTVAGVLSPARMENGVKTGILAVDVHSGESHLLASRIPGEIDGLIFGEWVFDPVVLEWGNQVLQHSIRADLLIIDEIGPLEFSHGMGWNSAISILAQEDFSAGLAVVRPECLEAARSLLGPFSLFDLDMPSDNYFEVILESLQKMSDIGG